MSTAARKYQDHEQNGEPEEDEWKEIANELRDGSFPAHVPARRCHFTCIVLNFAVDGFFRQCAGTLSDHGHDFVALIFFFIVSLQPSSSSLVGYF
jgi:hypothetical protein